MRRTRSIRATLAGASDELAFFRSFRDRGFEDLATFARLVVRFWTRFAEAWRLVDRPRRAFAPLDRFPLVVGRLAGRLAI
jgi:hypothetical protein